MHLSTNTRPTLSKTAMLKALPVEPVKSKLAGRNTLIYDLQTGERRLRYHDTDILTWQVDGTLVVNTGGFNTRTTRARLTQHLPDGFKVFTEKGVLYMLRDANEKPISFKQTMRITPNGKMTSDLKPGQAKSDQKAID